MNKAQLFSHPEIEFKATKSAFGVANTNHKTLLDLLELYPNGPKWKPQLDHSSLLEYFKETETNVAMEQPQPLRIFFVEEFNFPTAAEETADTLFKPDTTALWMIERFGVSPLFFQHTRFSSEIANVGTACFVRRDERGKRVSIDGMYRVDVLPQSGLIPVVWFSYGLRKDGSSTCILFRPSQQSKDLIFAMAHSGAGAQLLRRPFTVDAFIARESIYSWSRGLLPLAQNALFNYEKSGFKFSTYTPEQVAQAGEKLHDASRRMHTHRDRLANCQETVKYLIHVRKRFLRHSRYQGRFNRMRAGDDDDVDDEDDDEVLESLEYLLSKSSFAGRFAVNYLERVGIQINLLFNVSTQQDNRTNLDIARLTSKISVATQRDSSSMITIAAVTMFFLPGTFVSAIFSMVFFNVETGENGSTTLVVGRQWWLFLVITIPLTILVFGAWIVWQRYRRQREAKRLEIERLDDTNAPLVPEKKAATPA